MTKIKIASTLILVAGLMSLWVIYYPLTPAYEEPDNSAVRQTEKTDNKEMPPANEAHNNGGQESPEPKSQKKQPVENSKDSSLPDQYGSSSHSKSIDSVNTGEQKGEVTVSDIEKRYRPKFLALKQEYDAKINNLAASGMNEYRTYKQNGENPPVIKLAQKYLGAGNALEDECDRRFNALLAQMKQDLLKANLPLNIVEKAKSEYRSQKINRKTQLIKNGLKFMGD